MKTAAKIRHLRPVAAAATGILAAFVVSMAIGVYAAEKEMLKEHFRHLYEWFGQKAAGKVSILSGPEAVKMRRGDAPGKQWKAKAGLYGFKLTIENKAECKIEKLVGILEKLPASYMSACAAVSGDGEDGIAVYADLGGAATRSGKGHIDILPTADALAVARGMGRALAETANSEDETVLKQWEAAIASDKVSVSTRGDSSCEEDIAEYAELYAVCLTARESRRVGELQRLSMKRCALLTQMLSGPSPTPGQTPPVAKVSKAQIIEAEKLGVPVSFTNSIGMKFVLVPAGTFMMGSEESAKEVRRRCNMPQVQTGWFTDEHPRHKVTLTAFYMSIHEVTHWQYVTVAKPSRDPRLSNWEIMRCPVDFLEPDKPVVFAGWHDSDAFFKALNKREAKEGRRYSLPTEAQWEYACRAGGTTPFSSGETLSTDQANYHGGYTYGDGKKGETRGTTVTVGSLPANEWGLHEMHGNVSEWCSDWYADYTGVAQTDPKGPEKQTLTREHVIRGGAWRSYPGTCRSACRLRGSYHRFRKNHIGFRAVCTLPPKSETKKPSRDAPFFEVWDEDNVFGVLSVAMDGTVLMISHQGDPHPDKRKGGKIFIKRSEDGGATWSDHKLIGKHRELDCKALGIGPYDGKGWGNDKHHRFAHLGTTIIDEITGEIMFFLTALHPASYMYKSKDHGKTWKLEKIEFTKDSRGFLPVPNAACDPGITIKHGPHKGRLLVPSRVMPNYRKQEEAKGYTNAVYSDDHGKTWFSSEPFPLDGTGESGLVELSDGTIYINSRTHTRKGNRWIAYSDDSGRTWRDLQQDDELFDGPPDMYGCKAGLLRLDRDDCDILLFSSPDPGIKGRKDITVWVSFDGGKTWPHHRLIKKGPGNYTWMAQGRKGTPSEGFIYLLSGKDWMARFNLAWLLEPDDTKARKG